MPLITRRLEFDAGHRVLGHEGKCRYLHGHRYVVEISVSSFNLDELGRVIDFGVVKQLVGGWIDDELDHNMLLHPNDPLLGIVGDITEEQLGTDRGFEGIHGRYPFIMPEELANPTAENIAVLVFGKAKELLNNKGIQVERVVIHETPNCKAEYSG